MECLKKLHIEALTSNVVSAEYAEVGNTANSVVERNA